MNSSETSPFLSIILPVHNEENRLPKTLEQVARFVSSQKYHSEVLIVENGSTDRSMEIARDFCETHANFSALP